MMHLSLNRRYSNLNYWMSGILRIVSWSATSMLPMRHWRRAGCYCWIICSLTRIMLAAGCWCRWTRCPCMRRIRGGFEGMWLRGASYGRSTRCLSGRSANLRHASCAIGSSSSGIPGAGCSTIERLTARSWPPRISGAGFGILWIWTVFSTSAISAIHPWGLSL